MISNCVDYCFEVARVGDCGALLLTLFDIGVLSVGRAGLVHEPFIPLSTRHPSHPLLTLPNTKQRPSPKITNMSISQRQNRGVGMNVLFRRID